MRAMHASRSEIFSLIQPCLKRFSSAAGSISAITPIAPAISDALPCAPDMPPRPAVTNTLPFRLFRCRYFLRVTHNQRSHLPAFITVIVVPCTMPCGPM